MAVVTRVFFLEGDVFRGGSGGGIAGMTFEPPEDDEFILICELAADISKLELEPGTMATVPPLPLLLDALLPIPLVLAVLGVILLVASRKIKCSLEMSTFGELD